MKVGDKVQFEFTHRECDGVRTRIISGTITKFCDPHSEYAMVITYAGALYQVHVDTMSPNKPVHVSAIVEDYIKGLLDNAND